jgi:hypothetical protein
VTTTVSADVTPSAALAPTVTAQAPLDGTSGRVDRWVRRAVPTGLFVALGIAVWELSVRLYDVGRGTVPTPSAIATTFWDDRGLYPGAVRITASLAIAGFAVATLAAIAIAVTCMLIRGRAIPAQVHVSPWACFQSVGFRR